MTVPKAINGYRGWAALIATAVLSGSGGSIVTPMLAPDLYRKYPFTSLDATALEERFEEKLDGHLRTIEERLNGHEAVLKQAEVKIESFEDRMETMVSVIEKFAEFGPTVVRNKLDRILEAMQETQLEAAKERAEMRRQQELHFQQSRPPLWR